MVFNIQWYNQINSTNEFIKQQIIEGKLLKNYSVIATYNQTNGNGRFNRKWISEPNTNLCFSIFLKTNKKIDTIPSLTMAVAVAINGYLRQQNISSNVKWPNDVIVNNKKICGILSEYFDDLSPGSCIVIGIGLNVNMTNTEANRIDQPATSMLIEKNCAYPLEETLINICDHLSFWIKKWEKEGFNSVKEEWIKNSSKIGEKILIKDENNEYFGKLEGYGENGEILINIDGKIRKIWSGEIPL